MRIEPDPSPEETAAIVAALEALCEDEPEVVAGLLRSRWKLAGLLGHAPPRELKLHGSLWSYSSWKDMV